MCRVVAFYCKHRVDRQKQMVWTELKASYY